MKTWGDKLEGVLNASVLPVTDALQDTPLSWVGSTVYRVADCALDRFVRVEDGLPFMLVRRDEFFEDRKAAFRLGREHEADRQRRGNGGPSPRSAPRSRAHLRAL